MIQRDTGDGTYVSFNEPAAPALEVPDDHVADKPTACEISLRESHALLALTPAIKARLRVINRHHNSGMMMERDVAAELQQLNTALKVINRVARATLEGVGISAPC